MKKFIIGFIIFSAIVIGLMALAVHAAPITPPTGGGTGLSSASSTGTCLIVSSTNPFTYYLGTCGSGGGSSTTLYPGTGIGITASGTNGYVVSASNTISYYVAASNATAAQKAVANYICTGTNDNVCIQNAVNAASSSSPGNALIQLSPGTFNIAASLIISRGNIQLQGSGWNTILLAGNNLNAPLITTASSSLIGNGLIQDMKVDGNRTNNTSTMDCMDMAAIDQFHLNNLWVTQCPQTAIALSGTTGGTFGYNNWVTNSLFDGNGQNGITMNQNDENFIIGDYFKTLTGHYIEDDADLETISQDTFEGVSATSGIGIYTTFGNTNDWMSDLTFDGIPQQAIYINGSNNTINHINSLNCYNTTASNGDCILIKVGTGNSVSNSTITAGGNYQYAVDEQVNPVVYLSNNNFAAGSSGVYAPIPNSNDQDFWNTNTSTPNGGAFYGQVTASGTAFNVPTGYGYYWDVNGSPIATSSLYYASGTAGALTGLKIGTNLSISGGALIASGSSSSTYARARTKVVCSTTAYDLTDCDYFATATSSDIAINQATNAVSSTGGIIYLSEGTFGISTGTTLYSNETLEGAGPATILKTDASSSANDITVATSSNVIITNLAINGNRANTAQPGIGVNYEALNCIFITSSTNVKVMGTYEQNCYQGSIYGESSNGLVFTNNTVLNSGDNGIFIHPSVANQQSSNITIANNQVSSGTFSGIQTIRATNVTISNNVSYNNGNNGTGQGDGIGVEGGSYVTISGNVTHDNAIQGINVRFTNEGGATTTAQYVTVTGNTIYDESSSNGDAGCISISAASGTLVSNNNIYNCYYGISANSGGSGINPTDYILTGNKVLNATSWGIYLNNNNPSNVVVSNDNVASSSGGLYTQNRVIIQGGSYTGNSGDGIVISGTGASSSTIEGVTLYDNTNNAIEMENNTANVSVIGNYCTNVVGKNQGRCLYEDSGSGPTHMIDNYIVNQANQPYFFNNNSSTFEALDNGSGQTVLNSPLNCNGSSSALNTTSGVIGCGTGIGGSGGSGTVTTSTAPASGTLPIWTNNTSALGNSLISEPASSTVLINASTTNVASNLNVTGTISEAGATTTNCLVGILDPTPCVTSFNGQTGTSTYVVSSANSFISVATSSTSSALTFSSSSLNLGNYSTSTNTSLAGPYLATSTNNSLTVSSTLASSSVTMLFGNATTTAPAFQDFQLPDNATLYQVSCSEYASATTTLELFYSTSSQNNTVASGSIILSSINCTKTQTSTTSFTTSTIPAGDWFFGIVSSTVGTPQLTTISSLFRKT